VELLANGATFSSNIGGEILGANMNEFECDLSPPISLWRNYNNQTGIFNRIVEKIVRDLIVLNLTNLWIVYVLNEAMF